jgi:hypothetical protein
MTTVMAVLFIIPFGRDTEYYCTVSRKSTEASRAYIFFLDGINKVDDATEISNGPDGRYGYGRITIRSPRGWQRWALHLSYG